MGKFVSKNNLSYFWQKIKSLLAGKADKSEIPDTSNFVTTSSSQTLYKKSFNQVTINVGTSSTASSTATKVVTLSNFELKTGAIIDVKFSNGSYYDTGTTTGLELSLNVNSTGAKKIINYISSGASNNLHSKNQYRKWNAGDTVRFRYDGIYWTLVANLTTMTSYLAPVFRFPLRYNKSDGSSTYWYGTENLDLTHLLPSSVQYVAQTLTDAQKTQARTNIGAGTSNFSGNYNDLSNKPSLFSGNYNDLTNKPTIPTGAAASKGVVTTVDTSANLPTSNAVKTFVEGKGYITSSGSVANATKLNNQEPSYYLNYNNLSNKPTIPDTSGFAKTSDLANYVKNNANQTIKGNSSDTALILESATTSSFIGFKRKGDTAVWGYLGVNASRKPTFYATKDEELALKSDVPKLVTLTQAEYDALTTKDSNTYYFIKE